jgi:predicted metal-dependent peptidase
MDKKYNTNSTSIDQYSIFDLMGLTTIPTEQQEKFIIDMNALIWTNFIQTRLQYLLTQNQLETIREKLAADASIDQIINQITTFVPNFNSLLAEFTRDFKAQTIIKHHSQSIKDYEQLVDNTQEERQRNDFKGKRELHTRAFELAQNEEWDKVYQLFKTLQHPGST